MSNNYKVIGASDRNLKALSLAHTIGGSKTVAGYAKADLKFNEDAVLYTPEVYPFKMSILFDKETEEYKLNIVQGRVQITDSGQDRCYVVNFDENAIPLDSLSEDGTYGVELLVQYDPYGVAEGGGTDNAYFPYFIYFLPGEATTHDAVHTRGVFTIPLGSIKKETVEENVSYSLTQQIIGDFTYSFQACNHPFSITAMTNAISTGDLKSTWSLSDFEFNVMSGSVIVEQTVVGVPQDTFSASTDTFIYCVVSEDETAVLSAATQEVPFFNGTDESGHSSWNYLIGKIYNDDYSGVKIDQYIHSNFGTNGSANKVKSIEADGEADYLSGKLKFQEATDKKEFALSGYENGFIGGDLVSTQISVEGSDVKLTRYDIKPIWLYKEIFDFKDDKAQVLSHDNTGKLEWIPGYEIELTGSLKDWMQIEEISGSQYLRWRPEFDLEETAPGEEYLPFYFMSSVKKKKNDELDKTQVLSGLSFGIDEEKINGIMSWDFLSGYPKCETPPPSSDATSAWVFAGCKETGLSWTPLSALSGNLTVSGSLEYDFEVVSTTSGQVLRWHEEFSEEDKTPFNYILGQNGEDATFDKWTFLQEENEKASLFSWEYNEEGIGDVYLYTPPNKTEEISSYVLVGSAEEGFLWEPWIASDIELSGSIENIFEIVIDEETNKKILRVVTEFDETFEEFHWVCLENDGTLNYFNFEGEPEDVGVESIQIWDHEAKEPFVMYTPDYKEDDIYLLGGDKENGLHWTPMFETISGELYIVATDESDDQPSYLYDKLFSTSGSILVDLDASEGYSTVNLEINPDYFFSSDESIAIEATEDGLDFTISSYLVQVNEGDLPSYLIDKITSASGSLIIEQGEDGEQMTVNLEINPDYFFSSDGTVAIEATDEGLDFTLSSAVVSVTEDDLPQFLSDKITSASGSLIVDIGENGEGQTVNLEINPEYFFSSDETIFIEATEEGIDLKDTCKTKVQEDDESPGYLAEKIDIDPSLEGLITIENTGTQLLLKLAIEGSGLMKIENGQVSVLEAPAGGKYLLACDNGTFSWVEYADCENACDE